MLVFSTSEMELYCYICYYILQVQFAVKPAPRMKTEKDIAGVKMSANSVSTALRFDIKKEEQVSC